MKITGKVPTMSSFPLNPNFTFGKSSPSVRNSPDVCMYPTFTNSLLSRDVHNNVLIGYQVHVSVMLSIIYKRILYKCNEMSISG